MNNKPGIRTSEFWVMVIAAVLGVVVEMTGVELNVTEAAITFGTPIAYIVSRGLAKIKTP